MPAHGILAGPPGPMQGAFFLSVHSGFSLGLGEHRGAEGKRSTTCRMWFFVHKADVSE